jgi:hypothetical protein
VTSTVSPNRRAPSVIEERLLNRLPQLLNAPSVAFSKPYHHITLRVAPGTAAKDANLLPAAVERGEAQRYLLSDDLVLSGHIASL